MTSKVVLFGQSGCILPKNFIFGKVVVFGKKWLYSGKRDCTRAKVVVFGQGDSNLSKWLD